MQKVRLEYNRRVDGKVMRREKIGREEGRAVEARGDMPRGDYYLGLVLSLVWLVFLVLPIYGLLTSGLSTLRLAVAFAAVAVLVAAYVWLVLEGFHGPYEGSGPAIRGTTIAALVTLAIMVLFLTVFYSADWLWFLIFASTCSAMRLSTRQAVWTICALMVVAVGVGWLSGVIWQNLVTMGLFVGGIGFSVLGTNRMLSTIRELRTAREEIARLAVSEERLRFARDLHDLLGHSLSLITLKSELAGRLMESAPEKATGEIEDIENVARDALREVREAVADYRQPTLEAELAGARQMLAAAGIECRCEGVADPGAAGLHPSLESVLAWAVREGVTNVIRHSRAKDCEVRVIRDASEVGVEVTDDGRGTDGSSSCGSGLSGLAERVEARGGSVASGPRSSGGFRLKVTLPVADETVTVAAGGKKRSG